MKTEIEIKTPFYVDELAIVEKFSPGNEKSRIKENGDEA